MRRYLAKDQNQNYKDIDFNDVEKNFDKNC